MSIGGVANVHRWHRPLCGMDDSSLDGGLHAVHAYMIGEEVVVVRVQHHHVAPLAHLDAADAVGTSQGGGPVEGEGGDGLLDAEVHVDAGQGEGQGDGAGEATAGIEVGGQGHGATGVYHLPSPGVGFAQGEGGQGQEGGYRVPFGQGADAFVGGVEQVVGGHGTQFGGQFRSTQGNNLVGVQLQAEPHVAGGGEQAARLLDGEDPFLAEHVAELGQAVRLHLGHYFADEEIHILVRASLIFFGYGVCAEEGGDDVHAAVLVVVQAAHHLELQQFRFLVQSVAALALHGGDAHLRHAFQQVFGTGAQLDVVAGAGGPDGADDASAAAHDVHVAVSPQAPAELLGPFSAEDEVRVRVHEAGQHAAASGVVVPVVLVVSVSLFAPVGADVGDESVGHLDSGIVQHQQFAHCLAAAGREALRSDEAGVEYNQVFCHTV